VVSPLIALMADQVAGLQQAGVAAARLDSNIDPASAPTPGGASTKAAGSALLSPEGLMQPSMLDPAVAAERWR
jgi:ATP-dependent DNA helicase RecQ